MKNRNLLQKMILVLAFASYLAAIACGVAAGYPNTGYSDVIIGSLLASVVFFIGVGVVLHVLASTNLPDLRIRQ